MLCVDKAMMEGYSEKFSPVFETLTSKNPSESEYAGKSSGEPTEEPAFEPTPILMVETENVKPMKYAMTTENKVYLQTLCCVNECRLTEIFNTIHCISGFNSRNSQYNQRYNEYQSVVSRVSTEYNHSW